jgi:VanZ family protein
MLWAIVIAYFSLTSVPTSIPHSFFGWDKFHHLCGYAVFTVAGGWAMGLTSRAFSYSFLLAVTYGGLMELAQGVLTNNRTPDWLDFLANLTGATIVMIFATCVRILRTRNQ